MLPPANAMQPVRDCERWLMKEDDTELAQLEPRLAELARTFGVPRVGIAGLIESKAVLHYRITAGGESCTTMLWPWQEQPALLADPGGLVAAEELRLSHERGMLITSFRPQEGAGWLLWLDHDAPRNWTADDREALNLAVFALVRYLGTLPIGQRWNALLERARRQQRLDDASKVAGRLAHDFNNVLASVLGFTELTLGQLPASSPAHRLLSEAFEAAQHGSKLVKQLSQFSRRGKPSSHPACVAAVLEGLAAKLRKAWGESVDLQVRLPDDGTGVAIDPESLQSVLGALLDNAREAIATRGTITITAAPVDLDQADCSSLLGNVAPGKHLEIAVADDGAGFSPEARLRVLAEPFFSDKVRHRGLGLASAYGLLYAHQGGLRLEHGDPRGTLVRIFLPVSSIAPPVTAIRRHSSPTAAPPTNGAKVLVVDDDRRALQFICTTLEQAGYRVESARDGVEALSSIADAKEPFVLVLSDVVMPRMGGFDLAQKLITRGPDVPILFTSGHVPPGYIPEEFAGRHFDLLPKPFRAENLLQAVRSALARDAAGNSPSPVVSAMEQRP